MSAVVRWEVDCLSKNVEKPTNTVKIRGERWRTGNRCNLSPYKREYSQNFA